MHYGRLVFVMWKFSCTDMVKLNFLKYKCHSGEWSKRIEDHLQLLTLLWKICAACGTPVLAIAAIVFFFATCILFAFGAILALSPYKFQKSEVTSTTTLIQVCVRILIDFSGSKISMSFLVQIYDFSLQRFVWIVLTGFSGFTAYHLDLNKSQSPKRISSQILRTGSRLCIIHCKL